MRYLFPALLALFVICGIGSLNAQDIGIPYQFSFSSAGAEVVQFDFDVFDSSQANPIINHQLFYRDQPATSWNFEQMSLLYEACTTYTISTQISYIPPSDILEWYLRSENDSAVVSQSPKNNGDLFPVPEYLMADMGADSVGDAENAAGSWLDITHCYASYSDTKLYCRLDNNGGGFPTNSGLFTYFIYTVGIIDPDATDSVAYTLLYASIPALLNPGLYRFDPSDSSFTNIGDISYNISGNSLSMSCNISDLTAQPGWTEWPPASGYIGMAPVTSTQTLSELEFNDTGKPGAFVMKSNLLDYSMNTTPFLTDPNVYFLEPDSIVAEIIYTDSDDNLPIVRRFNLESVEYSMTACEKDYTGGTLFDIQLIVEENGWYSFYFEFSDGVDTVTTTLDSIYIELLGCFPGDADGTGIIEISDAVYIINYVFVPGSPAPTPYEVCSGDADCSCLVEISDAVYLINFVFTPGSPPPCNGEEWESACGTP